MNAMMLKHTTLKLITLLAVSGLPFSLCAEQAIKVTPREGLLRVKLAHPVEWDNLVEGGRFMDRFLPMPKGAVGENVWGAAGVQHRFVDNGIEHADVSFWGGNILKGDDGKFHFFVCGWAEDLPRGHRSWPQSEVYHTTSDSLIGPYTIQDTTIGPGGNPETYRMTDGRYVIYTFFGSHANREFNLYLSDSPDGPWEKRPLECNYRDRGCIFITNFAFAQRPDGSFIGVSKKGELWISQTGETPYNLVIENSVYPEIEGIYEDPVFWRDHVQYHMIMHDWIGHVSYYMRSKDGIHWVTDPGEAYGLGVAKHEDGTVEDWVTFERIKVFQDEYGRAIQANLAVIDVIKTLDKGDDSHSSKNVSIPLNPGLLMSWEGAGETFPKSDFTPIIRIKAEAGFSPATDLDTESLRFGTSEEVNYGRGSKVLDSKTDGRDLILTFDSKGHLLSKTEFAPKLLGRGNDGKMVYAYTRVPWVEYEIPILSARAPIIAHRQGKTQLSIDVENFGVVSSAPAEVIVKSDGREIGKGVLTSIQPYGKETVYMTVSLASGVHDISTEIHEKQSVTRFSSKVDIME